MNLRKITLKYMGWCPGIESAARFIPEKDFNVPAFALAFFILAFIIVHITSVGSIFYVNRIVFLAVLGFIVLVGIIWKRFKSESWTLDEFDYQPFTIDDLPDLPIDAMYTWSSSGVVAGSGGGGGMGGTEMRIELREPNVKYYRSSIGRHRAAQQRRKEGLPPSNAQLPPEKYWPLKFMRGGPWKSLITTKILAVSVGIFLGCTVLVYMSVPPIPVGPLQITVGIGANKQAFYDYEFNESFDYAMLWRRETVIFRERVDSAEFAGGPEVEVENTSFDTLDEVCRYVREEVGVPNVILGLTRYLLNQSFDETYYKIMGKHIDPPERQSFSKTMGDINTFGHSRGVTYDISRVREGLIIKKFQHHSAGADEWIWSLRVDALEIMANEYHNLVFENPQYKVQFKRYPQGNTNGKGP